MQFKEIRIANNKDDIHILVEYMYKKQLNIDSSCCICPKESIEIQEFLEKTINHANDFVTVVYSNREITGIGCFLYEPSDNYFESIGLFLNEDSDFDLIIHYLKTNYAGNIIDFVFPPENKQMIHLLKNYNAKFYAIQIRYELDFNNFVGIKNNGGNIVELHEEQYELYRKIHKDTDVYWTADRIINSPHLFKSFLAIKNNALIGYIDITYGKKLNEIYDLYVIKEEEGEYGEALLDKAISSVLKEDNTIIMLLDIDDNKKKILKKMGFIEKDKSQTITLNL
jgi:hypothetical protein